MNLIVDQGNSRYKIAVFQEDELIDQLQIEAQPELSTVSAWLEAYPSIERCMISSVGELDPQLKSFLESRWETLVLNKDLKLPFSMAYTSPETLGVDRIALVSAAVHQYPGKNVLVIDAGSCITLDLVDHRSTYFGGAIAPGLRMRYQAMHDGTANLPLLEPTLPESSIGDSTKNSMHVGATLGVIRELDGHIDAYRQQFGELTVILTGGDAHFLRDSIKNDIFAHSNFLLEGLNHLLEVNSSTF